MAILTTSTPMKNRRTAITARIEDDEEDPEDEMPCGLCPVCDDPVDHSDAGFCVHCGLAFHWSGCGQWHDDQHTCNNCKPKDD
jgi:hypothetical protein